MRLWPVLVPFLVLTWLIGSLIILPDFGPDEPYHVAYIDTLARDGRLPDRSENYIVQHPPTYYLCLVPLWKLLGVDQRPLSVPQGPQASRQMTPAALRARHIVRALQPLLAVATLLLMARTLALLDVSRTWQLLLLSFAAAWPMFGYISSVINNENGGILFSSLACFLVVRDLKSARDLKSDEAADSKSGAIHALKLGAILGAGGLIKQTTLFSLPLGLYALWVSSPRTQRARYLGVALLGAAAAGIWWPLHNWLSVGDPFPSFTTHADQYVGTLLWKISELPGCVLTILESSFMPDWSWKFFPHSLAAGVMVALLSTIALALWSSSRAASRVPDNNASLENGEIAHDGISDDEIAQRAFLKNVRLVCLTGVFFLLLGILQYTYFKDRFAQVGGRYWLNGLPYLIAFFGASLPASVQQQGRSSRVFLIAASALALLIAIDLGWWLIAWTHYSTLLNNPQ